MTDSKLTYEMNPILEDRGTWSVSWLLQKRAETHTDSIYLDIPQSGERYTYGETFEIANRLGSGLVRAGMTQGDRLLMFLPNCSELLFAWLGCALHGLIDVAINTDFSGPFLEHQVRVSGPKLAIISPDYAERFVDPGVAAAAESIERYYVIGEGAEQAEAIELLLAGGTDAAPFDELPTTDLAPLPTITLGMPASILFTSGTTGASKAVTMSNGYVSYFAQQGAVMSNLTEDDAYMSVGPLFHANTRFLAGLPPMLLGGRYIMYKRFSASQWVDWIRESGATVTNFVGVMMDLVWKQPPRPEDADNKMRRIFTVPVASSVEAEFCERFGIEYLLTVYGSTEASMPIITPRDAERPPDACGIGLTDWYDFKLVDPESEEAVADGEVGELLLRPRQSWTLFSEYWGMPTETLEAFQNFWFHTGDGLRRDEKGWYYFVDRVSDSIRRRGENISSYEIEQAVLAHKAVTECAAVAVPAEMETGEDEVMLCVVADGPLDTAELFDWCVEALPRFALPKYIKLMDSMPRTPSGKLRKFQLRQGGIEGADGMRTVARPEHERA
jgi:carnitine-CoA ligase